MHTVSALGKSKKLDKTTEVGGAWPLGVIRCYFKPGLDGIFVARARKAMRRWEYCVLEHTGKQLVKFIEVAAPASVHGDVVEIETAGQDIASPGYYHGRDQYAFVKINNPEMLPHELGHCIGLAHEHERPDAPAEVRTYLLGKFGGPALAANSRARYVTHGSAFDRSSIMMYATEAQTFMSETDAVNCPLGGCMIHVNQVDDMDWTPSRGDLEMIKCLYAD